MSTPCVLVCCFADFCFLVPDRCFLIPLNSCLIFWDCFSLGWKINYLDTSSYFFPVPVICKHPQNFQNIQLFFCVIAKNGASECLVQFSSTLNRAEGSLDILTTVTVSYSPHQNSTPTLPNGFFFSHLAHELVRQLPTALLLILQRLGRSSS